MEFLECGDPIKQIRVCPPMVLPVVTLPPGAALADTHCGDAGVDTPNLCFEHCRDGASTPSQASGVPDFGLALVGGVTLPLGDPAQPAGHFAPVRFGIEPGTPPPHAILHCCLRT